MEKLQDVKFRRAWRKTYMKEQSRKRVYLAESLCPSCRKRGVLKRIVYGLPGADFNFEKYIVGGCCVTDKDPEIGCSNCGWEGLRIECRQGSSDFS